jgi:hypothetical protein
MQLITIDNDIAGVNVVVKKYWPVTVDVFSMANNVVRNRRPEQQNLNRADIFRSPSQRS